MRASLRAEYGVDLRHPGMGACDLADLVANLPGGCAFWQSWGGPRAWSDEVAMLVLIERDLRHDHWMQAGGRGSPPKAIEPPPVAGEVERKNAVARARAERRLRRRSA